MSMIKTYTDTIGPVWLASEDFTVRTVTAPAALGTDDGSGEKYVKSGTVYPTNDAYAEGIIFEDVKVTAGDAPGSLLVGGRVYENRLSVQLAGTAKSALIAKGIIFETAAGAERLR